MPIDLALMPSTLDAVHIGLAAVIVVLTLIQLLLLSFVVMALLRRGGKADGASQAFAAEVPAPVVPIAEPVGKPKAPIAESSRLKESSPDSALQLMGLLQNEARFVDFIEEEVTAYTDAEIGAAARVVHEGCRKVLRQYFDLEPVRKEAENTRITVPKGFDAAAIRLTGHIVGQPPFSGTLVHRGWRVSRVKLPRVAEGHDTSVIATAEVEL